MAGYSAASRVIAKQTIEQTSAAAKTEETHTKFLEHLDKLFNQLRLLLKTPPNDNTTNSSKSIFSELKQICSNLIEKRNYYNTTYSFNIFNIILTNYIKLIDMDQFINIIIRDCTWIHNGFLRSLFNLMTSCDMSTLAIQITYKTRRDLFLFLLNEINTSSTIVSYLQDTLSISLNKDTISKTLINTCNVILIIILQILIDLKLNITNNDLEKYQNTLLNLFITFVDDYFKKKEYSRINEQQNDLLINKMLNFILDIVYQTLAIPIFININSPEICLQWLSLSYLNGAEYELITCILIHIARHDEGAILLKKLGCMKIIRQFKNEILNFKIYFIINKQTRSDISQILDLLLVLTTDPDDLDREEIKQFLSIDQTISKLWDQKYYRSTLFIALMKLCTNENVIEYIFQQDQFPLFFFMTLKMLLSEGDMNDLDLDILTIMAIGNILWSISFYDQYKNDFISRIDLIKKLEVFRESEIIHNILPNLFIPYQMSSLRRVIDGLWQNLTPSLPQMKSISKNKTSCSLMISYSNVNLDICRQLYDMLSKFPELSVSVDFITLKYLWSDIAEIIEQSDLVLFLITKDFLGSKSCRQELIYVTDTLKKPFIPIFIDRSFIPTGWLDKRIHGIKSIYFDMSICKELALVINEIFSMNVILEKNSSDIKQWNDEDIKQWFVNNNIIPELYDFYQFRNGNELLLYAQAILAFSWTKEYERIKLRFEEKFKEQEKRLSTLEFSKFNNALERLKNANLS